ANQLISVKKEIADFDHKKVVIFTETEVADAELIKEGAAGGEEKLELGEQSILVQLLMMMKSDKSDREAEDLEEREWRKQEFLQRKIESDLKEKAEKAKLDADRELRQQEFLQRKIESDLKEQAEKAEKALKSNLKEKAEKAKFD